MFGLGMVHATFDIEDGQIEVAEPMNASSATVVVDVASFPRTTPDEAGTSVHPAC